MNPLLEVDELCVWRGDNLLFDNISFTLNEGQVLQVRGANGSGKTTLLRIICGVGLADEGEVRWRGKSIERNRDQFNEELLYLGHKAGIKDALTAIENLRIFCTLSGSVDQSSAADSPASSGVSNNDLVAALEQVSLASIADLACRHMSAGQKRRVSLARLVLQSAKLWVLDEPLTSLDKAGLTWVEDKIAQHVDQGGAVLLTTHAPLTLAGVEVDAVEL